MGVAEGPGTDGLLSPAAQRLYGRITRQEPVDGHACGPELAELEAWGLITYDPDMPGRPVALDPKDAARRRMDVAMRHMAVRLEEMAAIPALGDMLGTEFDRAKWRSGEGCQFLAEPDVVNARLDHVVGAAEREILAAQPGGPRTREHLERSVRRDTAAVRRGVDKRTLYRDSVRDDAVTAEGARIMSAMGAEYRTLVSPFERCIVVDRREAFIADHVVPDGPKHAAWHVTDRAMVGFIVATFDLAWRRASPWHGELRAPGSRLGSVRAVADAGEVRTTPIQREILRDMVTGITQAATASRLGIGLRSLQRELDQVRELWAVSSLPELAYRWALSPDRLVDDQVDTISGPREDAAVA